MSKSQDHFEATIGRATGMQPVTFMVPLASDLTVRVLAYAIATHTTPEIVIAEAVRSYFGVE